MSSSPHFDRALVRLRSLPEAPMRVAALAEALATPYGIQVSHDDQTLFVTAMGTSRLFSLHTASGSVQDILDLGPDGQEIPKGVALRRGVWGQPDTAWVLNTLDNTSPSWTSATRSTWS